jgi:hypothetical protein
LIVIFFLRLAAVWRLFFSASSRCHKPDPIAHIQKKKEVPHPLTRPQTPSVVAREARIASAGQRSPDPSPLLCSSARPRPKFQFAKKKKRQHAPLALYHRELLWSGGRSASAALGVSPDHRPGLCPGATDFDFVSFCDNLVYQFTSYKKKYKKGKIYKK